MAIKPISWTDGASKASQTIDYAHHEVHSGSHFYVAGTADLASGATLEFLWKVPDTTKWPHALWEMETSVEMVMTLYEGCLTTANGTTVTIINNNRNSSKTPGVESYSGPTLVAGALGDGVSGGTIVWQKTLGAGRKEGGEGGREHEFIGRQDTKYVFAIFNSSGGLGWVNYDFSWYEHTGS